MYELHLLKRKKKKINETCRIAYKNHTKNEQEIQKSHREKNKKLKQKTQKLNRKKILDIWFL